MGHGIRDFTTPDIKINLNSPGANSTERPMRAADYGSPADSTALEHAREPIDGDL